MTVPHYGKREPGALTAASPGDTLYFNFGSYNDSGDSEALTGLAVTDLEVFKNGNATARATDSGYSLISDTGQIGDRVGLYRFSVQIYNTADDTGFYDVGGWYQVAVDSVTIDGKTVRAWVGSFEIGRQKVNVEEIDGDTGAVNRIGLFGDKLSDSGTFDTGTVAGDTGAASRFLKFTRDKLTDSGTLDTGTGIDATANVDTGQVNNAVWNGNVSDHVADTGSFGYAQGRIMAVRNDTGAAHLDQGRFGVISDSGRQAAVLDTGKVAAAVWTSHATRGLTNFAFDTGVRDTVWRASPSSYTSDTGSAGYALGRLMAVKGDTGAAHLDGGRLGVSATSALDTGQVNRAVWNADASRTLTAFALDTGVADAVWKYSDTDARMVNVRAILNDTGAAAHVQQSFNTGVLQFDTGANELHADIRKVNNIQIQGAGDTGTANTWRPV